MFCTLFCTLVKKLEMFLGFSHASKQFTYKQNIRTISTFHIIIHSFTPWFFRAKQSETLLPANDVFLFITGYFSLLRKLQIQIQRHNGISTSHSGISKTKTTLAKKNNAFYKYSHSRKLISSMQT